jgi:hypothetical protein
MFKRLALSFCLLVSLLPSLQGQTTQSPASLTSAAVQGLITQDEAYVAQVNSTALAAFNNSCTAWTATNIQNRALNLPQTSPPAQPQAATLVTAVNPLGNGVIATFSTGPALLGSPCAALPSATLPPNNIQVGQSLGGGYFTVGIQDTVACNVPVQSGGHTYVKVGGPIGCNPNSDGSVPGWYYELQ